MDNLLESYKKSAIAKVDLEGHLSKESMKQLNPDNDLEITPDELMNVSSVIFREVCNVI